MAATRSSEMAEATAEEKSATLPIAPLRDTVRTFGFFSCAVLLTGIGGMLFADLLWRTGWSVERTFLLILFCLLFFLGSIQLIALGIIGEYVGSIHTLVLKRPLVTEKERINFDERPPA